MPGLNGLVIMTPTSIASTGTGNSSSIGANGKVTFSSCETLSLNGVFTSSYDNYMVTMRMLGSTLAIVYYRMRASGIDNSASNSYVSQQLLANSTTVSGQRVTSNIGQLGGMSATQRDGLQAFFYGPNLAQPTAVRGVTVYGEDSARMFDNASTHNQTTGYDGFTLSLQSGTFTGAVTVYGFNQ